MIEKIKIFTAYHKEYELPKSKIYEPIHVGKELSTLSLGFLGDNTGENISLKNKNYCELTMTYWVWKNYDLTTIDYIGLAHYRRLFKLKNKNIDKYDIIIPQKETFGSLLFNLSLGNHYKYCHVPEDFEIMRNILYKKYPEYYDFDYVFNKRNLIYVFNKAHFYNMFIMKKEVFLEYTEWLFDILFECEQQIQISQHPYQARVFGFLGERLLNIYVEKKMNEGMKINECPLIKLP